MPVDDRPFLYSRRTLGIGEDDLVFAIATRAIREKGWAQANAALGRAQARTSRRLVLLLCGSGPEAERLQAKAADDPAVRFLGFQANVHGLYRLADVALLPTRFAGESFPLTIIQALQAGTPVIATAIGEIPRMVSATDSSAGILVAPDEDDDCFVDAIAEAMLDMTDDAFRRARAADAHRLGAAYDMRAAGDAYLDCYRRYLDLHRHEVPERQESVWLATCSDGPTAASPATP